MKIGIFSKFNMAGGSEFRCVTMANAIARHSEHDAYILTERGFADKLLEHVDPKVSLIKSVFADTSILYKMDHILVVNTDSKEFTTAKYWEDKKIDLNKISGFTFLFNFIVSPAKTLHEIEKCTSVRIITTNKRFFDELSNKDKHDKVKHIRRMILESPIDPTKVSPMKIDTGIIRIGKHSHPLGNKFNEEHLELIHRINKKYKDKVIWDFMGVPKDREKELDGITNVILRKVFSVPVKDYLEGIHIFLFYPSWNRQEPWARAVAEGLMSGCPVVAAKIDGGTIMQVIHGNNGYLCENVDDFEKYLTELIENPELIKKLGDNARFYARQFTPEKVIGRFLDFIVEEEEEWTLE